MPVLFEVTAARYLSSSVIFIFGSQNYAGALDFFGGLLGLLFAFFAFFVHFMREPGEERDREWFSNERKGEEGQDKCSHGTAITAAVDGN